ncbi:hypothetical protein AAGW05_15890 [Arthrobacter sp. LAPM80]
MTAVTPSSLPAANALDNHRQIFARGAVGRHMQPSPDPVPADTGIHHIETVDDAQQVINRGEGCFRRKLAGGDNAFIPAGIKILRFNRRRRVLAELFK